MARQKLLIYDLETSSVDPDEAIPRVMGYYSTEFDGFQWTSKIYDMIMLLSTHDVIVGYNNQGYDDVIMKRFGVQFYGKVNVDLYKVVHGKNEDEKGARKNIITTPDGDPLKDVLPSKDMDSLSRALKGPEKIDDFDYSMLYHNRYEDLTHEQKKELITYLKRDLDMTYHIYQYMEDFFHDFAVGGITLDGVWKPFLRPRQIERKEYLTTSVGAWVYKAICNMAGLPEEYNDGAEKMKYPGGYVRFPDREFDEGDIYCFDYTSAYPFAYLQGNLFARVKEGEGWKGEGICETEGTYDSRNYHVLTKTLRQVFNKRYELKQAKDPRQYTYKIIINTIYGLTGSPLFKSVHDYTAAEDCTRLVRQWIKAADAKLTEYGYDVLYGDTDSVYVKDPFGDKEKLLSVIEEHVNEIKSGMNFPQSDFGMSVDEEIRFIMFLKGADEFKKKNYLFVTKDDKLKTKGLSVIKSDGSPLGKHVFETYIKPQIVENHVCKFASSIVDSWVERELRGNIGLAAVLKKVKPAHMYEKESQLQCQIAKHPLYGPGQHWMLKLCNEHQRGCGTRKNYVGLQYADEVRLTQLDLTKTKRELEPFKKPVQESMERFLGL